MEELNKTNQFVFSKESLRKKFRLSEFLSEKIITGVAFLSITFIILIFFFVFKETLPIFHGNKESKEKANPELVQDQYGGGTEKQDQYGVATKEAKPADKPERYGVTDTDSISKKITEESVVKNVSSEESNSNALRRLAGKEWMPVSENPRYGMTPLLVGTLKITLIAMLFAAPIAILAALFSAAFAPYWLREIVKPAIELLAGFPSVVIGFFALMVMASFLQNVFGYETRLNAFVGGMAMALAAIPIIFTITEDALSAVPGNFTEASLALGASKWQTALLVVLPAATPGIFAAVLLGIGRVFGETMIALMATGNAAIISVNPFESVRTLAATIGAEMAEVVFGDTHYSVLFLIGTFLFIFTFSLNAIAEFYIKGKLIRRFQGRTAK